MSPVVHGDIPLSIKNTNQKINGYYSCMKWTERQISLDELNNLHACVVHGTSMEKCDLDIRYT